jgi:alpha-D-ribose 1-methylphosphonate 5-triphosphate synthase subunit PhnH
MISPTRTDREARAHGTFMALLWALSNPGRIETLPTGVTDPLVAIGEALIDLETSFFSPDDGLGTRLARTGARQASSDVARYHFYPTLNELRLPLLDTAPVGSYLYPDEGATIVVGCTALDAPQRLPGQNGNGHQSRDLALFLTGPGIKGSTQITVAGLSAEFWKTRERAIRYPLGWDVFLVAGRRLVGIPRTTVVEVGRCT